MAASQTEIECPFCHKIGVKAIHIPSHMEHKVSRISSGAKSTYFRVPEFYEILSDCPNCGKTKKEIQDELDGKNKEIDLENLKKRLKGSGLPTVIESKVR